MMPVRIEPLDLDAVAVLWVNMRNTRGKYFTSGVLPIADIAQTPRDFRVVPLADIREARDLFVAVLTHQRLRPCTDPTRPGIPLATLALRRG